MSKSDRIDRRHFAAQLALGAGALTAAVSPLASTIAAEDKPTTDKSEKTDKPAEKKADEAAAAPELPSAEVLLLTYLTRRHPSDRYDEAAIQGIFRDVRGDVARGRQLSEFPLKNSDEPAFVFATYRSQTPGNEQKETEGTK
ncbi:MAG: hypothetical protein H7062_02635 [Candidatus Saccharimonas sp.]|nr:hypothetical protein [Planctomycetaceae bacterium]